MNILFVFYVPSGGVETLNRQRCAALEKYNITCHCLYYQRLRDQINPYNSNIFIGKDPKMIKEMLTKWKYSAIVIVSDYHILSMLRHLGYQGKLIFEIQGLGSNERAREFLTNGTPAITNHANALLNPKTPIIEQLYKELFPSIPKFSFNNCFDTSQFCYTKSAKFPKPIIAWTGRIVDNKNWKEFLHIGHQLIQQVNPNIQLYMFEDPTLSDPRERKEFEQLIVQLKLEKKLFILQNVPNVKMAEYFSIIGDSGGFYCSTSKSEGAPYSVLEAMSCRCPVLTTDSGGVRSSIMHNQTGKYYQIGNIQEAVKEASELMTNHELREYIRANAFEHVKVNFSPELYSRNFINMLGKIGLNV